MAEAPKRAGKARGFLMNWSDGYFANTRKTPGVTCVVCATPVASSFSRCWRCHDDHQTYGADLANLVMPVVYGVSREQSGHVMRLYKTEVGASTLRTDPRTLLWMMMAVFRDVHHGCVERKVGRPIDAWTTVPSTRSDRSGRHPLQRLITPSVALADVELDLIWRPVGQVPERVTRRDLFYVPEPHQVRGRHVLVIDDTWTTGSRAQSAALAIRDAGAEVITILVLARWLEPTHQHTREFLRAYPSEGFEPFDCPVSAAGYGHA